jgi:hypothetical protein
VHSHYKTSSSTGVTQLNPFAGRGLSMLSTKSTFFVEQEEWCNVLGFEEFRLSHKCNLIALPRSSFHSSLLRMLIILNDYISDAAIVEI